MNYVNLSTGKVFKNNEGHYIELYNDGKKCGTYKLADNDLDRLGIVEFDEDE